MMPLITRHQWAAKSRLTEEDARPPLAIRRHVLCVTVTRHPPTRDLRNLLDKVPSTAALRICLLSSSHCRSMYGLDGRDVDLATPGRELPVRFGVHSWPKPPPRSVDCRTLSGRSLRHMRHRTLYVAFRNADRPFSLASTFSTVAIVPAWSPLVRSTSSRKPSCSSRMIRPSCSNSS
jgi:hypothetical protein